MGNYSNGNYTSSYQTDRPLEGSVVDLITGQENQDFKYRDEARQMATLVMNQKNYLDKQKADRLSAIQKQFDEDRLKYPETTGADSYDAMTLRTFSGVKDKMFNVEQTILKDIKEPGSVKPDELEKAKLFKHKTKDLADRYNFINKSLKEKVENYKKDLAAGTVHPSTEIQSMLMNGYKNIVPQIDDFGNINVGFADDKGKIYKSFSEEELKGQITELTPMQRTDYPKYLDGAVEDVKTAITKITTDKNYLKHEQEFVSGDVIKNYTKNLSPEANKSFARQFNEAGLKDAKGKPFDAINNLQDLQEKIITDIKLRMTSTDKKDFDYGAMNTANSNAETAKQNRINNARKDKEDAPVVLKEIEHQGGVPKGLSDKIWETEPVKGDKNGPEIKGVPNPYYGLEGAKVYNSLGGNMQRTIGNKKTGLVQTVESMIVYKGRDGKDHLMLKVATPKKVSTKTDEDGTIYGEQGGGVDYEYYKSDGKTTIDFYTTKDGKKTKTSSVKNASGGVDVVADFYTKSINPKTGRYFKNTQEVIDVLKESEQGQAQTQKIKISY